MMKNDTRKSPACCVFCMEEFTSNGLKLHYHNVHTEEGKINNKKRIDGANEKFSEKCKNIRSEYLKNPTKCKHCNKPIEFEKRKNKFCSKNCSVTYNNKTRTYTNETRNKISESLYNNSLEYSKIYYNTCIYCENDYIYAQENPNVLFKHCSHECLSKTRSKNAKYKVIINSRSKDEIQLYEYCKSFYDDCINNEKIGGWEADIFIPSKNLIIEWNGPWHYTQMKFPSFSLKQRISRDFKKIEVFESLGYDVKLYEDRYWTPFEAFIDILCTINKNR